MTIPVLWQYFSTPSIFAGAPFPACHPASQTPYQSDPALFGRAHGGQAELAEEDWADMVLNPDYDSTVNATAAFEEACSITSAGAGAGFKSPPLSWRLHACVGGVLQPLPP